MFNNKKGFTLIELLVVIAVIGILSTVVLVSLSGVREDARDSRRQSDMSQINLAMEMYNVSVGSYPTMSAGTNTLSSIGTYLAAVPVDPSNVSPYYYTWLAGTGSSYCVYVQLEGTDATTYYCASNKGVNSEATGTVPVAADCCNMNTTN
jgi:type II secretion system protein G